MKNVIYLTLVLLCLSPALRGQEQVYPPRWAIKTNLLYLATTTPNLSVEYAATRKVSIELMGAYNPFRFGTPEENKKIQHWIVRPEVRWWYCETFSGSFWGVNAHYGRFNAGGIKLPFDLFPSFENYRREGTLAGASLRYGYHWVLSPRWSIETSLAAGYSYVKYDKYDCGTCGKYHTRKEKHFLGPTGGSIAVVYVF